MEPIKFIKLSKDKYAIVDESNFEFLNQWRWGYSNGYATRRLKRKTVNRKKLQQDQKMHRLLMGEPACQVDHRDCDKIDNRISNLRKCTISQNRMNKPKHKCNTSGYKGVTWDAARNRWKAQCKVNGKFVLQRRFSNIIDAAKAYDRAAIKFHGEFAHINFPEDK